MSEVEARPIPRSLLQQEAWGGKELRAAPGVLPQPAAGVSLSVPRSLDGNGGTLSNLNLGLAFELHSLLEILTNSLVVKVWAANK